MNPIPAFLKTLVMTSYASLVYYVLHLASTRINEAKYFISSHVAYFLPFTCDGCAKLYCSEHRTKDSHDCSKECITRSTAEYTGVKGFTCDLEECSNRELTPVVCEKCNKNFCLGHRHAQDHRCKVLLAQKVESSTISKTAQHVNKILASKPAKTKKARGGKSSKTAAKVALMKMKLKAVGDSTPEEDRVYLLVLPPNGSGTSSKPMFFSKTWSIGRVVDSIANRLSLKNENNLANSKKLRLFSSGDGAIFPMDSHLETHVKDESLFSGSNVILEYVDNSCTHLVDFEKYKPG